MKTYQFLMAAVCCYTVFFSCKKESSNLMSNASTQTQQSVEDLLANKVKIDNPYFPLKPGTVFYYKHVEKDGSRIILQDIQTTVTSDIKNIEGVNCRVVHDVVRQKNKVVEDTYDYYTQDSAGNVWYFGEDTRAFVDGEWTTEGSWLAGRNGARPGIIMWADPKAHIGKPYRQEYLKDSAEDKGEILNVNSVVSIQLGTFEHCVATLETTRLEPGVKEYKYYAPGIGVILAVVNSGGEEHEELVNIKQ